MPPEYPTERPTVAERHSLARSVVEERPSLEDVAATACSFVERNETR